MKIKHTYGPKQGIVEHVSREVGSTLLAGGFAVELAPDQPSREHVIPPCPPRGYRVVRFGALDEKVAIRFDDGVGGYTIYTELPGPNRVWRYHPETGAEGYEFEPSDVPESVCAEFLAAKAAMTPEDPCWAADQRERAKNQALLQQQKENVATKIIVNTGKVG